MELGTGHQFTVNSAGCLGDSDWFLGCSGSCSGVLDD